MRVALKPLAILAPAPKVLEDTLEAVDDLDLGVRLGQVVLDLFPLEGQPLGLVKLGHLLSIGEFPVAVQ